MGASQSSSAAVYSGAQFVSGGVPIFRSYQPCHVFGDASLYSIGTRIGFYLQYSAAVLSILFLHGQDLKAWLVCHLPLAAASFVVLVIHAGTGNGLVVIDWAVMFGLVLWSILFLTRPIFVWSRIGSASGIPKDATQLQQELTSEGGRMVSDQEAEWNLRYIAVLKVIGTRKEIQVEHRSSQNGDSRLVRDELARTLQLYVDAFAPARGSPAAADAASYIATLYENGRRINDIVARMMIDNRQVAAFRDAHAEALRQANIPFNQAQATTQTLARMAKEGLRSRETGPASRSAWGMVKELGAWTGTTGAVGCGLGLILYSGYLTFMVWLVFRGIDHGAKSGCDIQIILFVVPVSVYNPAAITALRVLACICFAVMGVPALLAGTAIIAVALRQWWLGISPQGKRGAGTRKDALGFVGIPYDFGKGEGYTQEAATHSTGMLRHAHSASIPRASRASDMVSDASLHRQPSTSFALDPRGSDFYFDPTFKETAASDAEVGIRGGLASSSISGLSGMWKLLLSKRLLWEPLAFVVAVIHTIVVVELTIRVNKLDMRQPPMTSMGELVAFFLGVFLFVRVAAKCLFAGSNRLRGRQVAAWFDDRWKILSDPPNRWQDRSDVDAAARGGSSAAVRTFSRHIRESSIQHRIYLQPEGRSVSSMGKFKELMSDA